MSIALDHSGDQLYVASASELRVFRARERGSLRGKERALAGPCDAYRDLEWSKSRLHALCRDGRIFRWDGGEGAWEALEVAAGPPAIALQRSDAGLFAVREDGALVEVAPAPGREPRAAPLDRFRGADRGGAGEPPLASFIEYEPDFAVGIGLRHGVELGASLELRAIACRIPGAGGRLADLAVARDAIAAVHVDRRGRPRLAVVDGLGPSYRSPRRGLFDPWSGRRSGRGIRCWR